MTPLNRRRVLTSLSGGAAVATIAPGISKAALSAPDSGVLHELAERPGWLIAQRDGEECGQHVVKFWSMNWAPTHFANHLPPQISRGLIAYHDFGARIGDADSTVDPLHRAFENCGRKWIEPEQLDRFTLKLDVGVEGFLPQLTSFVGDSRAATRTALVDLDSRTCYGMERTRWRHILPAFARCYDFTIGLCHIEQRGLHQERAYLKRIYGDDDFKERVLEPASLCDTVIVTSAGLIETDPGLYPRASTEDLVGELVRRLGYALLEPKILEWIVATGGPKKAKPRFFALGSATLNAPFEPLLHLQMMLDRQSEFLSGSFAPLAVEDLPLFIATSKDDDLEQRTGVMDVLARAASISGYALSPDMFATAQAPRYQTDSRRPGWLDLIVLWPFRVEV
jgi:hypothetical protein